MPGEGRANAVCTMYTVCGDTYWLDENGQVCEPNAPPPTPVYNHVLYFHGRSMNYWPSAAKIPTANMPAGWDQKSFSYNGNRRLSDSATHTIVKNAL